MVGEIFREWHRATVIVSSYAMRLGAAKLRWICSARLHRRHFHSLRPPLRVRSIKYRSSGTQTVPMLADGGTFKVPVTINGQLTLDFIVDSGAADVSIPADVVLTLVRTGTLAESDFLDSRTYRLADGSTFPSQRFLIRSLKVGDKVLENITGSVAPVAGSLLLGQSFLTRFKSWSIDNQPSGRAAFRPFDESL